MIVNIDKVIVKDRIRKDFGDIGELAEDIKQNGLINPPVVNKEYELLAGERRLRACKSLGWTQIEIRMMDTRDAEHELNVEISENDVRKGFTKSERVDYMKRLLRIEQAKAKERMAESGGNISTPTGKSRDITAEQFGISGKTMEKEITIVENRNLLDPSDFADWDEGKLSTNKAFQRIKERQKEVEAENDKLRKALSESEAKRISEKSQTREVIKEVEVIPDDYKQTKADFESFKKDYQRMVKERQKAVDDLHVLENRIRNMESQTGEAKAQFRLEEDSEYFAVRTYDYIKRNGGYLYLFEKINQLPEEKRQNFVKAIYALDAFAKQLIENIGGYKVE